MLSFVKKATQILEDMSVDRAILDTLLYKNHHRFRNDKGYHDVRRISKTLGRFYEMDVVKVVKDVEAVFPLMSDLRAGKSHLYLPSLAMVEFVLLRLRGAFLLLEKLVVFVRLAGDKQVKRIKLGHFWTVALGNMAAGAKIG